MRSRKISDMPIGALAGRFLCITASFLLRHAEQITGEEADEIVLLNSHDVCASQERFPDTRSLC
jgi:hypothetical protein